MAENPWATVRETVGGIVLTATGGSVIPTAIAIGSPFWLAVGIAGTVVGVVVALHGAPLKVSSRGGGNDASPGPRSPSAQVTA